MLNILPDELAFIDKYRLKNANPNKANWLTNAYQDDVWHCRFGESVFVIDFRIRLAIGSLLTHHANAPLLEAIKNYLCAQTHASIVGVAVLADRTGKRLLHRALHVLDYFLLSENFVSSHSSVFRQLEKNDIHSFIATISAGRSIKTNIYEPEQRIAEFVRTVTATAEDFALARRRVPALFDIALSELPEGVEEEQAQIARVWLYANGYYHPGANDNGYKHKLSASRLLEYLIGTRVLSNLQFPNLELDYLSFEPRERFVRELPAAPIRPGSDDERASAEHVQSYIHTLSIMGIGITGGCPLVSDDALTALEEKEVLKHGRLKPKGRYATLPFEVANLSLGRAIEFYLEYGEDLVNYYLALAEKNWLDELLPGVPPSLQKLGITRFKNRETLAEGFFTELRSGSSLYEMLQVLIGAIAVLVNTLMARRSEELRGLKPTSIVKDGMYFLLAFNLGKSNLGEIRERVLRPLPALGAEALALLARLNERLKTLGYESSPTLFQRIKHGNKEEFTRYGTVQSERGWLELCLDRFCDFVEMPNDENGRRYYIRLHQLRRNFAMLFFWQGSFGGIQVLRYFLGHHKPSMTYRYVSETTKGEVLRRVKAKVATELIKADSSATQSLAEFICVRHGITLDDLHVLPEADVIAYIEDLLSSREAEIEPEFVDGPNGEEYKILYKVYAVGSPTGGSNAKRNG